MKALILIILSLSCFAEAQVIVASRGYSLTDPHLNEICKQMTSNHLDDLAELKHLYDSFREQTAGGINPENESRISEIISQIKVYSERIQYLAKPEWNSEIIPIELIWEVPNTLFFNNDDYLALKDKVRDGPGGRAFVYDYLTSIFPYVAGKKIIRSSFKNSENTDVIEFISLGPTDFRREDELDRNFYITYKKNVTILEACQFLNTLIFELEIDYVEYLLQMRFEHKKNIFLIYRKEI